MSRKWINESCKYSTSESPADSLGNDLVIQELLIGTMLITDSYEQFITILNSAFGNVNRFSKSVKTGTIDDIVTDLYEVNTPLNSP